MVGDIEIFKMVIVLTLNSLVILLTWSIWQLIAIFLTLGTSQMTILYDFKQAMVVLLSMGKIV